MAKGGGSQLAQLRSKLHTAGVTDRRQQSKKAKQRKGGADEKDAAAARRNKINAITSSLNPFEEKVTKPKHEVLGRKIKGAVGRPGAARDSGLAQRKATLLPEWQARNKSGTFVDRRFGENDANLTPEERMLERFTAEKQRKSSKSAMYNLNDGEDEGLTHYGQSLSGFDDLADIGLSDDEDETMDDRNNFGGFGEEQDVDPDRVKTKAEVMKEVMAKSKLHKLERQKVRDEDDELRQQLDNDLGDIRALLMSTAAPEAKEQPAAERSKSEGAAQEEDGKRPLINPKVEANTYDSFVKELAFERRAKPQDRLKSEAEMAAEEAKRLMKAEKARLKRMRGDSDDEEDEEEAGGNKRRRNGDKSSKKTQRAAQADDLDDDFQLDGMTAGEAYGLGSGLKVAGESDDEEEDENDEEDEEEDAEEEEDDDDDDDEEDDFTDLADVDVLAVPGEDEESEEEGDQEALVGSGSSNKKKAGKKSTRTLTKEQVSKLPFTFPCPSTHEGFLSIFEDNIEFKYIPTIVKRIRTLYHASLNEDNKHKLQAFIGVLLDHALHSAALASADGANRIHFAVVNALIPHIFSMAQTYPTAAAHHFVSKLALMQRNLSRGLAKGALSPDARTWPTLPELTLLRITGTVWPTSDRYHAVTTPLAILMAQYLGHARIRSLSDLASGLFLCSLVISHEKDSRRLFPEATNFLYSCISILSPVKEESATGKEAEAFGIPTPDVSAPHTASLSLSSATNVKKVKIEAGPVNLIELLSLSSTATSPGTTAVKVQLLNLAVELLGEFSKLYQGSTATVELFTPYVQLLSSVDASALPASVSTRVEETHKELERQVRMAASSRRHLRLQAHRAIAIQSYVPKFDQQGFNPERKGGFDPDTERAQISKMRALIKKERKGAVRELRKDSQFIAEERRKEQAEEDQRYKKKIDKIMSTIQDERSEQKQMDRQKARLKKRAGGKK